MILTVTLNSCVHEFITFEDTRPNEPVVRPVTTRWSSGGKGFNVARVIHRLGGPVLALGTAGGMHGLMLRRCLDQEDVPAHLIPVAAETRVSHCLYETREGRFRELLEAGTDASPGEAAALAEAVRSHLADARFLTLNGSSPGPVLDPLFHDLVRAAREHSVPVILDSYGIPGARAHMAVPDWIRCNRHELTTTFGVDLEDTVESWWQDQDQGLQGLLVSDGAGAAYCVSRQGRWRAQPPDIQEVNPVGSGDAMTGAFALALSQGQDLPEALIQGVAAGSANAESLAVCEFATQRWQELQAGVRLEEI